MFSATKNQNSENNKVPLLTQLKKTEQKDRNPGQWLDRRQQGGAHTPPGGTRRTMPPETDTHTQKTLPTFEPVVPIVGTAP